MEGRDRAIILGAVAPWGLNKFTKALSLDIRYPDLYSP
jgi:hypothetical protein